MPAALQKSCVPKLRFPEFQGDWQAGTIRQYLQRVVEPVDVKLDEQYRQIGVRSHGKGLFHKDAVFGSDLGEKRVFWVRPNALVINIVFAWEQAIALTTENERGMIASHRFPMFSPVEGKSDLNFKLHFFMRKQGKELLTLASPGGAGRNKTLGQSEFMKLKVTLPVAEEQKKIAAFLSAVDSKLAALRRKRFALERYKKGLMQQLFSRRLRFTRSDGTDFPDWEEKELGQISSRNTQRNSDFAHTRVLTNSAVQGVVDQGSFFDKDIANSSNIDGYYVVHKGDFVYNPRISVTAPVGPIKRNNLGDGVMSPLYTVFRFHFDETTFFEQYFQTNIWHEYMKSVANYGARHDRMSIGVKEFMALPLPVPHIDEQRRISKALSAMDAKNQAVSNLIDNMESFRKSLLQQMFV